MTHNQSYAIRFRARVSELSAIHEDYDYAKPYSSPKITHPCRSPFGLNASYNTKKRNYGESFGERDYEFERYGQEIAPDFFTTKHGHC